VAKLKGPFHWHKHDDTDDFFLVLKGVLDVELRDRTVTLNSGEVFVVPAGDLAKLLNRSLWAEGAHRFEIRVVFIVGSQ
jgi:mannose-6-phosphate isomerase-like protein (cupin superfamily)